MCSILNVGILQVPRFSLRGNRVVLQCEPRSSIHTNLSSEWDDADVRHVSLPYRESGDARDDVETAWTCGSRIHHPTPLDPLDQGAMRVPIDQDILIIGREQSLDSWAPELVPMADMNAEPLDFTAYLPGDAGDVGWVHVPRDRFDRRDLRERGQDMGTTDVPGVENQRNALERRRHARSDHSVRIRDQANDHHSRVYGIARRHFRLV
jgi:hypothetical protein